jgi:hypothetical protein
MPFGHPPYQSTSGLTSPSPSKPLSVLLLFLGTDTSKAGG